ncbi:leukosialin [Thomomys bottae]
MALLLLLFGSLTAPMLSLQTSVAMPRPTAGERSPSLVSDSTEVQNLLGTSNELFTRETKDGHSTWSPIPAPSPSMPSGARPGPLPVISVHTPEPTISQDESTKKPSLLLETSSISVPREEQFLEYPTVTDGIMTPSFQETSSGTKEPSVTTSTHFLEPSSKISGFPVTVTTRFLEPSNEKDGPSVNVTTRSLIPSSGPSVTMTTRPLDPSKGPSVTMTTSSLPPSDGPSVTMATRSLEPSNGPSVTMATRSLEPFYETSGLPVTIATSSLEVSSVASGSPVSNRKLSVVTTPKPWTHTSLSPSQATGQRSNGTLLVPILVALLVVIILLALFLLWRQRQKQRTGVLMLNRSGKCNGVVDAWAGPAQVADEEAVIVTVGGSGGDKGSGIPETSVSGQGLSLTTFFGRRKSHQSCLALEDLKPGSGPSPKGEEEPLMASEDEVVEAPTSNGPEVEDGAACE